VSPFTAEVYGQDAFQLMDGSQLTYNRETVEWTWIGRKHVQFQLNHEMRKQYAVARE